MSGVVDSTPFIHDSQYLVAGNHSAYRLTSTGPWKCGGPRNDPISFFTPVVLNAREVVIAARILGTSYVNGHPAWHLQLHAQMRLNNTLPGLHFAAQRIRLDEYIAKDHNRLLRETERLYVDYGRGDREWIDGSFSFTSYDAPVQVTLPSACRGKAQ